MNVIKQPKCEHRPAAEVAENVSADAADGPNSSFVPTAEAATAPATAAAAELSPRPVLGSPDDVEEVLPVEEPTVFVYNLASSPGSIQQALEALNTQVCRQVSVLFPPCAAQSTDSMP